MTNENSSSAVPASGGRWRIVFLVAALGAMAVLTVNVWLVSGLVHQQRESSQEHDFWVLCHRGSSPRDRETSFRRLIAIGNTQWRGAELWGLNLSGVLASGADLQFAGFVRTNLSEARLDNAKLCNSTFELADLSGADLTSANLREARLLQATLTGATLRRANLCACQLEQVQATNADFLAADLSDADCFMANLSGAKLMGANFSGAKLQGASLRGANLSLARFDGADLKETDFTNTNWWRARGLTTKQLSMLKEKHAPGSGAPNELKEDFARWAGENLPGEAAH